MILRLFGLLALLAAASLVLAEPAPQTRTRLSIQTWRSADGLPHNMIHALAQTPDGYLWIATWEGLARFNGYGFFTYAPENTKALTARGVRALAVDGAGQLWAGTTGGGVVRLTDGSWSAIRAADGLASDDILSLLAASDGSIWVGTQASGITILADGEMRQLGSKDGLVDETIVALAEDGDGAIWIASRGHVHRWHEGRMQLLGMAEGLPSAPPLSLFGNQDYLLVGTEAGIYRWTGERFQRHGNDGPGSAAIPSMTVTASGELWAGTLSTGLYGISDRGDIRLDVPTGLPNNRITTIFEDSEGSLWVGTSAGLAQLRESVISSLTRRSGLSDDYVRAVLPSGPENVWIATSNGLNHYDGERTVALGRADGLGTDSILSLAAASDGGIWAGTYGGGLNRISAAGEVLDVTLPSLPSGHIRTLLSSHDGALWIGTIRGVVRWHGDEVLRLSRESGLTRDFVMSLSEDAEGGVWIGGLDSLARWHDGELTVLDGLGGFRKTDVFAAAHLSDGSTWLATPSGLLRHEGDHFTRIDRRHGLPHEVLFGLVEDEHEQLWMSSNVGLFRAPLTTLHAVADGNLETVEVEHFTEENGLASRQANGGSTPSVARGPDGRIWVATSRGVAVVDPGRLTTRKAPSPPTTVQIEAFLIDGAHAATRGRVRIVPGTRHLEFHFAGLQLATPLALAYRYRLVGYDDDWHLAGTDRRAHYTNLDPGEYRFEVESRLDGDWVRSRADLRISVEPHFYETSTFFAGIALALVLSLWAGVRWRLSSLRQQADRLSRQVAERTSDLRQRTQELERLAEERSRLLVEIERQARAFERQAREDSLTGLPNRRRFDECFREAWERADSLDRPLSVAIADVDHFKRINDRFSHQVGDEVLVRLGRVFSDLAHDGGITAARYGGEEFAVLFDGHPPAAAQALCESLRASVEQATWSDIDEALAVTISVGLCSNRDQPARERMLVAADNALYRAKTSGRNRVQVDGDGTA